ncbi:MAG: amidohydrolase family protein [Myxococcota bacterium]
MVRGRRLRAWFTGLLAAAVLVLVTMGIVGGPVPDPAGQPAPQVAFTGVQIVDVARGELIAGQTIIASNGEIESIGPTETTAVPDGYREVAMPGRFVVPGFWNMHAHLGRHQLHYAAPMMLMYGIFYARNMSGDCVGWLCFFERDIDGNRALTEAAIRGDVMAPAFLGGVGSHVVRGVQAARSRDYPSEPSFLTPQTYDEGRALVRYAVARDADFLKPYNSLDPDAFRGMLDEARAAGVYVGGHVPRSVTLTEALQLGLHTVEHARMLPLACSTKGPEFAAAYRAWLDAPSGEATKPNMSRTLDEAMGSPDDAACDRVLADWVESGAHYVPTHVTRLADSHAATRPFLEDPRLRYVPNIVVLLGWETHADNYEKQFRVRPEAEDRLVALYERGVELTGRAHRAGVKLMVGSDTGDVLIYPGPSFHEEMRIFSDAGMSPAAILAAATSVPAAFAGLSDTHGSIAVGKRADFVFLNQNPLDDIAHSEKIDAIYVGGRFYDSETRRAVMDEVASKSRGLRHHLTLGWFVVTHVIPGLVVRGVTRVHSFFTSSE